MRILRRLPLREATHELLEAVGVFTVALLSVMLLLVLLGEVLA